MQLKPTKEDTAAAMKVILASSSPFRRDMFRAYFPALFASEDSSFLSPDIDEKAIRHPDPERMVVMIADGKLEQGVRRRHLDACRDADLVVCCDQVVSCGGQVREKPEGAEQAAEFARSYAAGTPADCLNGVVVWHPPSGRKLEAMEKATVVFGGGITREELEEYVREDPQCRRTAGGFSVGHNSVLSRRIRSLEGSVSAVEGFPFRRVQQMMLELCPQLPCQLETLGRIKCAVFDMDGLLLDTETFYTVAQNKILARFGLEFSWEVKAMMMGRKATDAAEAMIKHYGLEGKLEAEDFLRERGEILDKLFPKSELMPGIERLLRHLKGLGIPMAIATSSNTRHYEMKTRRHKEFFDEMFDFVVTGDMVKRSKPEPDIFQDALKGLKLGGEVTPEQVLVFEDAPLGIQAAKAAGMKNVLVSEVAPEKGQEPDLYLKTMMHFLPEQWGLEQFPRKFESKLIK